MKSLQKFSSFSFKEEDLLEFKNLLNNFTIEDSKDEELILNQSFNFALNLFDINFVDFLLEKFPQKISNSNPFSFYTDFQILIQKQTFWDSNNSSIMDSIKMSENFETLINEDVIIFLKQYIKNYKNFIKNAFLLAEILKILNNSDTFINKFPENLNGVKQILKYKDSFLIFKELAEISQNYLIKKYFLLLNLTLIDKISFILNYFLEKIDYLMENYEDFWPKFKEFWSLQKFIEFCEIIENPNIMGQILLNFCSKNTLEIPKRLGIYCFTYFSSILAGNIENLNRIYKFMRQLIVEALEEKNFNLLKFVFTTILDYDFILGIFNNLDKSKKGLIKEMISNLFNNLFLFIFFYKNFILGSVL